MTQLRTSAPPLPVFTPPLHIFGGLEVEEKLAEPVIGHGDACSNKAEVSAEIGCAKVSNTYRLWLTELSDVATTGPNVLVKNMASVRMETGKIFSDITAA